MQTSSSLLNILQVTTAIVKIVEKPWERVQINGQPHEHGNARASRLEHYCEFMKASTSFPNFSENNQNGMHLDIS